MGCVCRNIQQESMTNNDGEIFIASVVDQDTTETMALQLISKLSSLNPQSECEDLFASFLCLTLFGICDDGALHLPSVQECENVMNSICPQEWVAIFNTTDCIGRSGSRCAKIG